MQILRKKNYYSHFLHMELWWRWSRLWVGFFCWEANYFSVLTSLNIALLRVLAQCRSLRFTSLLCVVQVAPSGSLRDGSIDLQGKPSLFVWFCFGGYFWFCFPFIVYWPVAHYFCFALWTWVVSHIFVWAQRYFIFPQFYWDILEIEHCINLRCTIYWFDICICIVKW